VIEVAARAGEVPGFFEYAWARPGSVLTGMCCREARQGAADGDRSSYLDDPSIKPNFGADAEY
jgi:hypothetical protein